MGIYANYTNGKLTISKDPITINGIIYDPKIHKEDIKGFKWFKNKNKAKEHYNMGNSSGSELHLANISNGSSVYVVGIDDMDCRDKVMDFIRKRFFADPTVTISSMEHIAETETKGFVNKLIL